MKVAAHQVEPGLQSRATITVAPRFLGRTGGDIVAVAGYPIRAEDGFEFAMQCRRHPECQKQYCNCFSKGYGHRQMITTALLLCKHSDRRNQDRRIELPPGRQLVQKQVALAVLFYFGLGLNVQSHETSRFPLVHETQRAYA